MPDTVRQPMLIRAGQIGIMLAVQAVALFLSAGTLRWSWAWGYLALYVFFIVVTGVLLLRFNPGLIAERASNRGAKRWDAILGGTWAMVDMVDLLVVAGLDFRLGWSGRLPLWVHALGEAVFLAGMALFVWGMVSNARFAQVVRVGQEGEHVICQGGPYAYVRHPGYAGAVLQSLGLPLLLGSWWALIPGGVAAGLMVLRTALEDRTLLRELAGYTDYASRVRYRLIPGVW